MAKLFKRRQSDREELSPQELFEVIESREDDESIDLSIPDFPEDLIEDDGSSEEDETETPAPKEPVRQEAEIYTFIGACGGVGTTTLAVQTAYELALKCQTSSRLARGPRDPQVCLIDLNLEAGACAHHLDIPTNMTVDDLSGDPSRIDPAYTSSLISTHKSGISLLALPPLFEKTSQVNPHSIMAILDSATRLYRYVVIDMPRKPMPWSLAVMGGSDFVGIVTEMTVPSLHLTRQYIHHTEAAMNGRVTLQPILSKYERRSFRNMLRKSDAESALLRKVWATLCLDVDTARESVNCGEPMGAIRKDGRYAKDSRVLIEKIAELQEDNQEIIPEIAAA